MCAFYQYADQGVMDNLTVFSTICTLCVFCMILYRIISSQKGCSNLPPGPPGYPMIGNILDLKGTKIEEYYEKCRRQYGDIFCVRFMSKVFIVINGYDTLKEAFITNGQLFSDRPYVPLLDIFPGRGVTLSSGPQWKTNRRFLSRTLHDFCNSASEDTVHEEIQIVLSEIERYNGEPFDIGLLLHYAVSNTMNSVVFGRRYAYSNKDFQDQIKILSDLSSSPVVFLYHRLLRFIPGDPFGANRCFNSLKQVFLFIEKNVHQHMNDFDETNIKDLIDTYIKEMKCGKFENSGGAFNENELVAIVGEIFAAGGISTAVTLKWGLLYLLRDQELQARLHTELDNNVSRHRLPAISDKPSLPNIEATIMEIQRLGNIGPFLNPHAATRDCSFNGYSIPKEAYLVPNIQSVLYDKTTWGDPEIFRPSRFLDEDGAVISKKQLIPFSLGKRACPGANLVGMELYLFFTALIQRFKFIPPDDQDAPTLDYTLGSIRSPKPFRMRAISRQHHIL